MPNLDLLGPWQVLLGLPIHENVHLTFINNAPSSY